MFHRKGIFILAAFVIVFIAGAAIVMEVYNSNIKIPQNQFGITEEDDFFIYDVSRDGRVRSVMSDFTNKEKIPILVFLAGLDDGEVLKTEIDPKDVVYNYPPELSVNKEDYRIAIYFHSASNIEYRKINRKGNIETRIKFKTPEDTLEKLFLQVGIRDL